MKCRDSQNGLVGSIVNSPLMSFNRSYSEYRISSFDTVESHIDTTNMNVLHTVEAQEAVGTVDENSL